MGGHRPFSELVGKMRPKAQEEIKRGTSKILAEMELAELRQALSIRQKDLAQMLRTTQAAVSRLERRGNVTLGSLNGYIEALGGRLELNAILPGHTVKIAHAFKEKIRSTIRRKRKAPQTRAARGHA
jgi:transcriptional regulator with XRE-family HTH domain